MKKIVISIIVIFLTIIVLTGWYDSNCTGIVYARSSRIITEPDAICGKENMYIENNGKIQLVVYATTVTIDGNEISYGEKNKEKIHVVEPSSKLEIKLEDDNKEKFVYHVEAEESDDVEFSYEFK